MPGKHVLILFADQQRQDTIGAYGNTRIQTPHLDSLAAGSVIFDTCITPAPVCVPARLSLMAGQYPARTGCNNNNAENVYKGEGFYSCLTKAGFESCCVGKMHYLKDPYGSIGFKKRITQEELAAPEDDYTKFILKNYPEVFDYHGMRSEMYYVPQVSQLPAKAHPTQWIGDHSVEYIKNHNPEKPMFLMSSFIHPHPPYAPPAPWNKLYRDDPPAPYRPADEDLEDMWNLIGDNHSLRRHMISEQDLLRTKNFYYACVSFVDYQVGRILDALKESGMYDDTLIIYSSDHGDMMGDFGSMGKRTMVDPSCRVPLIMHYPGMEHERRKDVCSLVDIAPTVLSYAGIPYEKCEYDGINLMEEKHSHVFSQYGCGKKGVYMVTDGQVKLVYNASEDRYYFFEGVPEKKDTYEEGRADIVPMKEALDAYRLSDANMAENSVSYEPVTKKHPHYAGRMDHRWRHDEELNAVPPEYHIDLE